MAVHARKDYDNSLSPSFERLLLPGEPVLVFRGKDKHFVEVVAFYRELIEGEEENWDDSVNLKPGPHAMATGLTKFEVYAEDWQTVNTEHVKNPDVPEGQMRLEYEVSP